MWPASGATQNQSNFRFWHLSVTLAQGSLASFCSRSTTVLFNKVGIHLLCGGNICIAAGLVSVQPPDDAAPKQGFGVVRIEPECLGVVGDGASVVLVPGENRGAIVEGNGEFRIEPDRFVVVRHGAVGFVLPHIGEPAIVPGKG